MPLSKWCQLTRDANVGRNAEKAASDLHYSERRRARKLSSECQGELSWEERGGDAHCLTGLITMLQINPTKQVQAS